jgi:catechol 2,3-dioxygenase-like lactoylglutathione lyase family enzyme
MLTAIHPKLPMRHKPSTEAFYTKHLGFTNIGAIDYPDYLMLQRDEVEIHFFSFKELDPSTNYGQVYIRVKDIETLYKKWVDAGVPIHPNDPLQIKPWLQKEFSVLDPDNNLLTFGEGI